VKDSPKANGAAAPAAASDKAEKEKLKKQQKKDKKEREKAEKIGGATGTSTPDISSPSVPLKGSISSPMVGASSPAQPPSSATLPDLNKAGGPEGEEIKSPLTDGSGGARTPRGTKPPRNPWTIFMRMNVGANEAELREFFGTAKDGVSSPSQSSPCFLNAYHATKDHPDQLPSIIPWSSTEARVRRVWRRGSYERRTQSACRGKPVGASLAWSSSRR
jgi:hypothetical protein